MEDKQINLTDRQAAAWQALHDDTITDVMYGGAKGGGKSFFFCVWVLAYCRSIVDDFNLQPSKKPPHIGWIGRKQAVDFTGTTLETWKEVVPEEYYEIKSGSEKSTKHILLWDRVAVDFGGLDRQENVNKFNSAEYGFIGIDQAEETTKDEVSVLRASRRLKIHGKPLKYKALFTANPANCWLKDEFLTSPRPNYKFIQALPTDNPHLPDNYVQTLKDAFEYRPELLAAYLDGSWELADDVGQIIKTEALMAAYKREWPLTRGASRKFLSCDIARFGDDETVIYTMDETEIIAQEIYGKKDTMYTANLLTKKSMDLNDCWIVIDEGGVGGGVVDRLRELKRRVVPIDSGSKSDDERYYNKRAEVWENAARMFQDGDIVLSWPDDKLKADITTPTYKFRNSKILVESKEDIKKRLRRSTDRADAYVNGLYGMRFIPASEADTKTFKKIPHNLLCGVA